MTAELPPPPVPDPVRPSRRWRLPEAAWPGRIIFFAIGAFVGVISAFGGLLHIAATTFGRLRGEEWHGVAIMFVTPAVFVSVVVAKRIRHGRRWRWLSFLTGCIASMALLIVPVVFG